jgi:hypothetical protein
MPRPLCQRILNQLAAFPAEHVEIAAVRITPKGFLHQQGQRVCPATRVGVADSNPYVPDLRSPAQQAYAPETRRGPQYLMTMHVECPQVGHSNVRMSWPGLSGSMRASLMARPHLAQSGRGLTSWLVDG